jgi:hypothetical protein
VTEGDGFRSFASLRRFREDDCHIPKHGAAQRRPFPKFEDFDSRPHVSEAVEKGVWIVPDFDEVGGIRSAPAGIETCAFLLVPLFQAGEWGAIAALELVVTGCRKRLPNSPSSFSESIPGISNLNMVFPLVDCPCNKRKGAQGIFRSPPE